MNTTKSQAQSDSSTDSADSKEAVVNEQEAPIATSAKAKKSAKPVKTPTVLKAKTIKPVTEDKPTNGEKNDKGVKPGKKKPKLVRDSFTFPAVEYAQIAILKQRVLKAGSDVKKSELMRAGLAVLSALTDAALLKALAKIDKLKPGRPAE